MDFNPKKKNTITVLKTATFYLLPKKLILFSTAYFVFLLKYLCCAEEKSCRKYGSTKTLRLKHFRQNFNSFENIWSLWSEWGQFESRTNRSKNVETYAHAIAFISHEARFYHLVFFFHIIWDVCLKLIFL